MRIAVLSDVHSNLEALTAVLERARAEGSTSTYVLGDIVGYGADPGAVVQELRSLDTVTMIAGNHDLAATGRFDTTWFNSAAEAAIRWTEGVLDGEARGVLEALEPRGTAHEALLVHGSVVEPATEYLFTAEAAERSFAADEFALCFFGHTHMPTLFEQGSSDVRGRILEDGEPVKIEGARFMLNPGSVGQPRDGDARASFMIYDADERTATVHRVAYDVARAQGKIRDAGLPRMLADRLAVGK